MLDACPVGTKVNAIPTPAVTIELDILARNVRRVQDLLEACGLKVRPHVKTHKIPAIARMQLEAGAIGITCQKLSEAEAMADGGLNDILLTYNVLGKEKLKRLVELARRVRLAVTVDNPVVAKELSSAFHDAGIVLPVLCECDTGGQRCGVQSPSEALELAQVLTSLPGLEFHGLMTHPTLIGSSQFMQETRRLLTGVGLNAAVVSGGGTPELQNIQNANGFTEHRPGTYIYNDRNTMLSGWATKEDCAMRVRATVVSRPRHDRAILDAGAKTLTSDLGPGIEDYGLITEHPDASLARIADEHGVVDVSRCVQKPEIGEVVTIIPNHACTLSNLHDLVYGVRNKLVAAVWQVSARGCVQ